MGETVFVPAADNHLYALNRQDGTKRWEFVAGHALWASPVADSDVLYQASLDHHVYALNTQDGSVVWDSGDLGGQIVAAPAINANGSILYTTIFGSKVDDPERSSKLIALNAETGKEAWKLSVVGWVWATPVLHEDTLYFGDTAGYFYAVDAQQGRLRWKYPQSGEPIARTGILGAPVVVGDQVYFGNEAGTLTALNLVDGTLLWEKAPWDQGKTAQIYADLKAVENMILIAPTNYANTFLVAVDMDGNLKWQFPPAEK
jgi:outer membrane protein assembly factor BamB